jgi:polysaccharide biosynthesis/export protein
MQPARLGALVWFFVPTALLVLLVLAPPSSAQQQQAVLETPQQLNDRIRQMSAAARLTPHDYVLGNGDVLDLDVFDVKELSREVRVSQTGSIGIPLVPVRLHVAGLTEVQAQQKIAEVLEANGLVSHADVSLSVKERKSKPITVVGAVGHAMVYQADRAVTLLEVLAEAGGVATDAGDTVIVNRPVVDPASDPSDPSEPPAIGPEGAAPAAALPSPNSNSPASTEPPPLNNTITINLNELMETGNATNNIVLQAGDIVTVPHSGIVYVLGAVGRPGGFVLSNDRGHMSALKLLALAGGLNPTAKSAHCVIVRKDAQGQQREVAVNLKKVMLREEEDVLLQPSDILYVPNSAAKQAMIRALEFGIALGSGVALYRVVYH